jgi:hypothetical protein
MLLVVDFNQHAKCPATYSKILQYRILKKRIQQFGLWNYVTDRQTDMTSTQGKERGEMAIVTVKTTGKSFLKHCDGKGEIMGTC